jgi:hypothetical protein
MRAKYSLRDFSPGEQDKAAIGLLIRRKALDDVMVGRIEAAIEKCRLEWASLPGSPYGQRTESLQRVLDTYIASGGSFAPAPAETATAIAEPPTSQQIAAPPQSIPVEASPMTPFIAAALPALVQSIPELIRSFGDGQVTERNAKAAEAVLQIAQSATGTPNAQAAVEAVQADPAAREAVTRALEAEHWFEVTEAGGGGIEGAREYSLRVAESDVPLLRIPAVLITLALLPMIYVVVLAPVFLEEYSGEMRAMVIGAVLGVLSSVVAYFLGQQVRKVTSS